ncbi:dihydrofolate reductase [Nocardioides marinisabuli]|uniref:Dihydrofolate reductase n=1 Tax=Nocardioides marinisabuli TaxID=419476 RepID=A0A7Y9JRX3_9ACTN|nr:dihydrofolate reductase [Nocardioides marinisabuli]NYD58716.1 dihydrofolate reductase [Nocardioides marinisabuli]
MTHPSLRPGQRVVLVAAYGRNRVIGADGDIPWRIPEDFAHFKRETLGHTLVMGRRTWDSIGRPLPGRTTVVLTRDPGFDPGFEGVRVVRSLDEALEVAAGLPGDVVVAGGGEVYRLALPLATHQVLTEVDLEPAGDATYPEFDAEQWVETRREPRPDLGLDWVWWERR